MERAIFMDSAYQLFDMINKGSIHIPAGRYTMFIPYLIPLFAIKIGLSLKAIYIAFSISFIIIYYLIYLLSVYRLNNEAAGLSFLFVLLIIRSTFYHALSESMLALAFATLFYAWITYTLKTENKIKRNILFYGVSILLILACYYAHPISLFLVAFALGYVIIDKKLWKSPQVYVLIILALTLYFIRIKTDANSYDGKFYENLKNYRTLLPHIFDLFPSVYFKNNFSQLYIYPTLLFAILLIYYLIKKYYLKALFILVSCSAFSAITIITFVEGGGDIPMERTFLPLIFFVGLPFANDLIFKNNNFPFFKSIVIIGFMGISLLGIYRTGKYIFKPRIKYIDELYRYASKIKAKKLVIERSNILNETLCVPWAFAEETIMYSSLFGKENTFTAYITNDLKHLEEKIKNKDLFLSTNFWEDWSILDLNFNYFKLPSETYKIITETLNEKLLQDNFLLSLKKESACDVENISANGSKIISSKDVSDLFGNPISRSEDAAHSGKFSVKTSAEAPFSLEFPIKDFQTGDEYFVSVWRKGNSQNGNLVISTDNNDKLYIRVNEKSEVDTSGWERLTTRFEIYSTYKGENIKCFVWNSGNGPIYFDDMVIRRYVKK